MSQIIVSIGRENGSGGRDIAIRVANELNLPFYDSRLLLDVAKKMNMDLDPGELSRYDEAPRHLFFSRRVRGEINSVEEILARKQFDYLKEKADSGESFVVLGRCADRVLKDREGLLKIFITADEQPKKERIAVRYNVTEEEAEKIIKKNDKERRQYYEYYSEGVKWGDSSWHDLVIRSNKLGIDNTATMLVDFIRCFESQQEGA